MTTDIEPRKLKMHDEFQMMATWEVFPVAGSPPAGEELATSGAFLLAEEELYCANGIGRAFLWDF